MEKEKNCILVVDDEPVNLQLFKETLQDDYQLAFATNGVKALEAVSKIKPDLILLDIMMPEMDGYETCRKLKSDPNLENIPVIFVTAKGETDDESKGFELGAIDYMTKPFEPTLLRVRVQNHLELKDARDELIRQNEILLENIRLREDIERITRHDLKGPLNGIISFPDFVEKKGDLNEEQKKFLHKIKTLGYRMLDLINLSLDMYKMETGVYKMNPGGLDLIPIIKQTFGENEITSRVGGLKTNIVINGRSIEESDRFNVFGETLLYYSMLSNVIKNAFEASPEGGTITISLDNTDGISIRVHNMGTVPEEIRDSFFEKYVTAGKDEGTGLGTYSAKMIAKTQNGTVNLETSTETGTTIIFSFPEIPPGYQ